MTEAVEKPRLIKSFAIPFGVIVLVFFGFAAARESGLIGTDTGKRGVAAMLGLLLAVCGNALPKVTRRLDMGREAVAAYARADRFAGWALVVSGVVYAAVWAMAPMSWAPLGASLVGFVGLLLALGLWLYSASPVSRNSTTAVLLSKAVAGRVTGFLLLAGLFVAGAMFPIDAIWGDAVVQPLAIGYSIALPLVGVSFVAWAKFKGESA